MPECRAGWPFTFSFHLATWTDSPDLRLEVTRSVVMLSSRGSLERRQSGVLPLMITTQSVSKTVVFLLSDAFESVLTTRVARRFTVASWFVVASSTFALVAIARWVMFRSSGVFFEPWRTTVGRRMASTSAKSPTPTRTAPEAFRMRLLPCQLDISPTLRGHRTGDGPHTYPATVPRVRGPSALGQTARNGGTCAEVVPKTSAWGERAVSTEADTSSSAARTLPHPVLFTATIRRETIALAAIIAGQAIWFWWAFARGWFLQADLSNLAEGVSRPFGWSYLTANLG